MLLREFLEATSRVWGRIGNKQVRKYRCTHGVRKGRVMSSPAACNAPINIKMLRVVVHFEAYAFHSH